MLKFSRSIVNSEFNEKYKIGDNLTRLDASNRSDGNSFCWLSVQSYTLVNTNARTPHEFDLRASNIFCYQANELADACVWWIFILQRKSNEINFIYSNSGKC